MKNDPECINTILGPGFSQVPGGPEFQNRSVFSWHYYCELFEPYNDNTTISSILNQFFCDVLFGPDVFHTVDVRTKELGGGSMLTEVKFFEQNNMLLAKFIML